MLPWCVFVCVFFCHFPSLSRAMFAYFSQCVLKYYFSFGADCPPPSIDVQCGNVRVHCDNANASCTLTIFHCSFIALVNFSFEQFVLYLNATFAAAVATCDILFRASASQYRL